MSASESNSIIRVSGANRAALIVVGVLSLLGLAYAVLRVDILRARIGVLRTELSRMEERQHADYLHMLKLQTELNELKSGMTRPVARQWARTQLLYLLRVAQQQLQWAHDPVSARGTLELALVYLNDDPDVLPEALQQQMRAAYKAVLSVPASERQQVSDGLMQAEVAVAQLPLAQTQAMPVSASPQSGSDKLKQAVQRLISLRRSGELVAAEITAQEALWYRQALRQWLVNARLAVMRHDAEAYQQALRDANAWLDTAFDANADQVRALREQLSTWAALQVAPPLPNLQSLIDDTQRVLSKGELP